MAAIVRPLPSGGFAFHAASARLSIRYWLIRLLVLKAFRSATGIWRMYGFSRTTASTESRAFGMGWLADGLARESIWHKLGALTRGVFSTAIFGAVIWARDSNFNSGGLTR